MKSLTYLSLFLLIGLYACEPKTSNDTNHQPAQEKLMLKKGWNAISFYVHPDRIDSVQQIFAPVKEKLDRIESRTGAYHGAYSLETNQNSLPPFKDNEAYLVRMNSDTSFLLKGELVITDSIHLDSTSTNHCGYFRAYYTIPGDMAITADDLVFASDDQLLLIHDFRGGTFWPEYNINNIGLLMPGDAYLFIYKTKGYMKVKKHVKDETRNIPTYVRLQEEGLPQGWELNAMTPFTNIMLIPNEFLPNPKKGDVIAAFTKDGICAGLDAVDPSQKFTLLNLYAFDAFADKINGFKDDQEIYLKYLHADDQSVEDLLPMDKYGKQMIYADWDAHIVNAIDKVK